MKALTTLIAASFVFANAASAAPGADSQVGASNTAITAAPAAAKAEVPKVTISKHRTRAEVHAEAVEAMKNHKTALAIQLEQYQ